MYCGGINAHGISYVYDSQTSVFIQHIMNNLDVFNTGCIFSSS